MPNSEILAIAEVGENQNDKYITINDMLAALEAVGQDYLPFTSVGTGPVELTQDEATRYMIYEVSGASADFDLVFPADNVDSAPLKRFFVVKNLDNNNIATVITDAPGLSVDLAAGDSAILQQRGDDIVLIARTTALSLTAPPYDIGVFIPGLTEDNQVCLRLTAVRSFKFPDNFSGSDANTGVNPTATATFTIEKNGASIGTLSFNTSGVPTFLTTGSGDETFVAGDVLEIVSQATADATMEDISITLKGERT